MKNECTTEARDGLHLVKVAGEVDLSWSQSIRKAVLDALGRAPAVGVDLSAVTYIDSSGIAALVEGFQSARGKGQKFALVAASPQVRAVLQLARLDRVFPMVDTAEAVTS
ncbi:MAG: STAS domain-containing protein [Xanthomonadaceae bacterium]|jgi:anti-sigma B factor antagonist|nr:STAS domain-containing protein [Xanthomonadaceae bacterium]